MKMNTYKIGAFIAVIAYLLLTYFILLTGHISFVHKIGYHTFYTKNAEATVGIAPAVQYEKLKNHIYIHAEPGQEVQIPFVVENYTSDDVSIHLNLYDATTKAVDGIRSKYTFDTEPRFITPYVEVDNGFSVADKDYVIKSATVMLPDSLDRDMYVFQIAASIEGRNEDHIIAAQGARINLEYAVNVYLDLREGESEILTFGNGSDFESMVQKSSNIARIQLMILIFNFVFLSFYLYNCRKQIFFNKNKK